jgi:Domain of unknown function (DUF222)
MPQDPFPDRGPDAEEPGSSPLPPAEGDGSDEDGEAPAEQGLYVCLPAEQLTLSGFAQGGQTDTMAPGPLLATVVHTVMGQDGAGLAGCSDDQLLGIISASQRMESNAEWTRLAAIAEFTARHPGASLEDEFAADELASELHLTPLSAAQQMDYADTVARRLPKTFAALAAGRIRPVHLRIIEDETSILTDKDAAHADQVLAEAAPGKTYGELRSAAHRLVLQLDPEAVRKRKEAAQREAHVRRFREDSGNAGMVARELPSAEVLASWQHVEQRALDLRAAGVPGSLQELRVRAYLDLLQERDSRDLAVPGQASAPDQPPPDSQPPSGSRPDGPRGSGSGPTPGPGPAAGPSLAALVTITIPWATKQGRSELPGEADGFGVLDGDEARDLAAAAARHPRTRWCVTALHPDGTAAAHACLPGRHPPPGLARLTAPLLPVVRGPCDHAHAEVGYHPSRKLAHLIRARNGRCTAPGCSRPAARCDLDHTHPWDQGGPTCDCNLAPPCKR